MDDKEIVAKEEHPGPEEQKDGRAGLRAFLVELAAGATLRALDAFERADSPSSVVAGGPVVLERRGPACTKGEEGSI